MTRGKSSDSPSGQGTGSAINAEPSIVVDFWTYKGRRQSHLTDHDPCDNYVNSILGCIAYLRGCRSSITAQADPLLHLRFGLGLRRVALERAVRALGADPDEEPQDVQLLALIARLFSRLSAVPEADPTSLHSLAEELQVLCGDLIEGLYALLPSSEPKFSTGNYRVSPAAPD